MPNVWRMAGCTGSSGARVLGTFGGKVERSARSDELYPPVARAPFGCRVRLPGPRLAEPGRRDPGRPDSVRPDERLAHRSRAPARQVHVVLVSADAVGVPLD